MTTEREWLERSGSPERPMIRDRRDFLKVTFGSMLAIGASGFLAACGGDDDDARVGEVRATSAGATTTKPVELMKISAMMPFAVGINFIADTAAAAGGFFERQRARHEPRSSPRVRRSRCSSSRPATSP